MKRDQRVGVIASMARTLFVAGLLGSTFSASAGQRFELGPPRQIALPAPAGAGSGVEVADLNADGRDDVVVVVSNAGDSRIVVYLQKADGSLEPPRQFAFDAQVGPIATTLVGVRRGQRGRRDLAVAHPGGFTFLSYSATSHDFRLVRRPVSGCRCDKVASVGNEFGDYVLATTGSADELLSFQYALGGQAAAAKRLPLGFASGSIEAFVAAGASHGVLLVTTGSGVYSVPLSVYGGRFGSLRRFEGLAPGETAGVATSVGRPDGVFTAFAVAVRAAAGHFYALVLESDGGAGLVIDRHHSPHPLSSTASAFGSANLDGAAYTHSDFSDLLVAHAGDRALGFVLSDPLQYGLRGGERETVDTEIQPGPSAVAGGDIDGDGMGDVAHLAGGDLVVRPGRLVSTKWARSDSDNDGLSDVFWSNQANGQASIWRGAQYGDQVSLSGSSPWRPVATGDFDANGFAEHMWYQTESGEFSLGKGGNVYGTPRPGDTAWQKPPPINANWAIVATGDFDGDGAADLIWRNASNGQNALWRGGNYYNPAPAVTTVTDLSWEVVGAGDFDGDGRDDLVWRHRVTGANAIWNGADYRDQTPLTAVTNTAWRVAAVADFDGDGCDDIFWRDGAGANVIWRCGDSARGRAVTSRPVEWLLATAGDYDGDGRDDVLWRNRGTGANTIWPGAVSSQARAITAVTNLSWVAH